MDEANLNPDAVPVDNTPEAAPEVPETTEGEESAVDAPVEGEIDGGGAPASAGE